LIDTWRLYPVLALTLLAGASIWLERATRSEEQASTRTQSGPDFIATQTRVIGFAEDGSLRYELLAERLEHDPHDDVTRLQQPRLHLHSAQRETRISAQRADVSPGGERVDLAGEVHVRRSGTASEAPSVSTPTPSRYGPTPTAHTPTLRCS